LEALKECNNTNNDKDNLVEAQGDSKDKASTIFSRNFSEIWAGVLVVEMEASNLISAVKAAETEEALILVKVVKVVKANSINSSRLMTVSTGSTILM
jgi:hypothetical protein